MIADDAFDAPVAVDADGVATAVFAREVGNTFRVEASRFSNGTWSPPQPLSATSSKIPRPALAVAGDGTVIATWERFDGADYRVEAARVVGGVWQPTETVLVADENALEPQIVIDADDVPTIVWSRRVGDLDHLQATRFTNGNWQPVQTSDDEGPQSSTVFTMWDIEADPGGGVTAIWGMTSDGGAIYSARLVDGLWLPAELLATGTVSIFAKPRLAIEPDGSATATWTAQELSGPEVHGVRRSDGWGPAFPIARGGIDDMESASNSDVVAGDGFVMVLGLSSINSDALVAVGRLATPILPTAPTDATATAHNASATVSWSASQVADWAAVVGYTVTAEPGGSQCTTEGATSCVVGGLLNDHEYTFTVKAANAAGWSPPSLPSAPVVPTGDVTTAVSPTRFLETRNNFTTIDGQHAGTGRLPAGSTYELPIQGRHNIPNNATAAFITITAVNPHAPGYITAYPCGQPRPTAANLTHGTTTGAITNSALTAIGDNGNICIYNHATTDLTIDINGYEPAP